MPARNFLPALPGSILSETYTGNGIVLSFNEKEWAQTEMFFTLLWNILHSSPYRRETVQHLIISLLYNLKYTYEQTRTATPLRLSRQEENIPALHSSRKTSIASRNVPSTSTPASYA